MYAVIETGGKQYRVELGSELAIERLDVAPGDTVRFERVLLIADGDDAQIGTPVVADALVTGEVLRQDRGEKIIVFKYRPKARHRAKKGHRQEQTVIRVADITFGGKSAAEAAGVEKRAETKSRQAAAAEAEKKAAADAALAEKLAADEAAREAKEKAAEKAAEKPATKATTAKASTAKAAEKPATKAATTKASTAKAPAKASTTKSTAAKSPTEAKPAAKPKSTTQSSAKSTSSKTQQRRRTPKKWHTRRLVPAQRTVATALASGSASRPVMASSSRPDRSSFASAA
jgi:large subunit ribosomal protein L21